MRLWQVGDVQQIVCLEDSHYSISTATENEMLAHTDAVGDRYLKEGDEDGQPVRLGRGRRQDWEEVFDSTGEPLTFRSIHFSSRRFSLN